MSGGKGGSTSSSVTIPEYIEAAARRNLTQADKIRKLGYVPEYGPTIAALTPMQEAASQNIADTASAFGTAGGNMSQRDIMGGMPEATTYAGGVRGYSAAPLYEQSLQTLAEERPGQKDYIDSFFIDQFTGAPGSNVQAPIDYTETRKPGDLGGITVGGGGGGGGGDDVFFPETQFNDTLSVNTPVLTTDDLRTRIETEMAQKQADARARADAIAARAAAANVDTIFQQNQDEGNSSFYTGSNLPGFSTAETKAAQYDPRGANQIPAGPSTNILGDFFGGLGLNVTGPLSAGNTGYITGGRAGHVTDEDREFDAFYDTKVQDPLSGKMLTPFQLNNRLQPGSLGSQYADMGITSLGQILNPTPPPPLQVIKN